MNEMNNATLDIGYFDARDANHGIPAQVTFSERGMTLLAEDAAAGHVLWEGERHGPGHFVLRTTDATMQASLHHFADSVILEGFWLNGKEKGFWRLHLPADAVIPQQRDAGKRRTRQRPSVSARPASHAE